MIIVIAMVMAGLIASVQGLAMPTPDRRAFCIGAVTSAVFGPVIAANAKSTGLGNKDSVVEREKNTFAALINEFKNTDKLGGLDAKTLNEPSIPFLEFGEKMKKGEGKGIIKLDDIIHEEKAQEEGSLERMIN
jgi:hypothetical protein